MIWECCNNVAAYGAVVVHVVRQRALRISYTHSSSRRPCELYTWNPYRQNRHAFKCTPFYFFMNNTCEKCGVPYWELQTVTWPHAISADKSRSLMGIVFPVRCICGQLRWWSLSFCCSVVIRMREIDMLRERGRERERGGMKKNESGLIAIVAADCIIMDFIALLRRNILVNGLFHSHKSLDSSIHGI